jgi:hypothetical protein
VALHEGQAVIQADERTCQKCHGGVRCPVHAVAYALRAMEERGMVPIHTVDLGRGAKAPTKIDLGCLVALADAEGLQVQRWIYQLDVDSRMVEGWYVPRQFAFLLAVLISRMPWDYIHLVVRQAKAVPDFLEGFEAAWRLGGIDGVNKALDEYTPGMSVSR